MSTKKLEAIYNVYNNDQATPQQLELLKIINNIVEKRHIYKLNVNKEVSNNNNTNKKTLERILGRETTGLFKQNKTESIIKEENFKQKMKQINEKIGNIDNFIRDMSFRNKNSDKTTTINNKIEEINVILLDLENLKKANKEKILKELIEKFRIKYKQYYELLKNINKKQKNK